MGSRPGPSSNATPRGEDLRGRELCRLLYSLHRTDPGGPCPCAPWATSRPVVLLGLTVPPVHTPQPERGHCGCVQLCVQLGLGCAGRWPRECM